MEAKKASTGKSEVYCQLCRNIRIVRSMMVNLEKYGVDCPPVFSIHGLTADVFRIRSHKTIYVAGRACARLVLPESHEHWLPWLQGQAQLLCNLMTYYNNYSTQAAIKIQKCKWAEQVFTTEELGPESEEGEIDTKHIVMLTPTKKRDPPKEVTFREKPNNRRFHAEMQKAVAELREGDSGDDNDEGDDQDWFNVHNHRNDRQHDCQDDREDDYEDNHRDKVDCGYCEDLED